MQDPVKQPHDQEDKFKYVQFDTNKQEVNIAVQVDNEGKVECPNCGEFQERMSYHLTSKNPKIKCKKESVIDDVATFIKMLGNYKKKIYRKSHSKSIKLSMKEYRAVNKEVIKQ